MHDFQLSLESSVEVIFRIGFLEKPIHCFIPAIFLIEMKHDQLHL